MANYAIARMEKRRLGEVTAICNHHERLKEKYKSNPDIDLTRSHLNFHLVKPDGMYRQIVLRKIEEAGAKRRKDSIVMQDCLVAATPDWFNAKSDEEQAELFRHAFEFFREHYRIENIVSAVVHLDEANPHMHICFVPLTEDNRLSSKEVVGGPAGLKKFQTDFYEHMAEKYPDLSRGIPKSITHRKHLPTYLYKQAAELHEHYEEIVKAIDDIGLINNSQKKEAAVALLGRYAPEMAQLCNQVKMTDKHIDSLEQQIETLKKKVSTKTDEVWDQKKEIEKLKSNVWELNQIQKKLQKQIDRIPPDVLKQMAEDEKKRRRESRER